jgi:hypothetical protein
MIPALDPTTGNLPPGIHEATWSELSGAFGTTPQRRQLLAGLRAALESLRRAGCRRVYVDGSFVTAKAEPADFDGCWEAAGVDPRRLDPELLDFTNVRQAQKAKYRGELFIANTPAAPHGPRFVDFFQIDKQTGLAKGIVALDPQDLA